MLLILTFPSSAPFVSQVSEQQLNDAIAQAVENSKLRKDKSQWSIDGEKCNHFAQSHTAFLNFLS